MEAKVHEFNNLPRPRTVPGGKANRWVFGACHVDLNPSGDIVMAVHPESRYLNVSSPTQVHSLPSLSAKADAIVPYLLEAFLKRNSDMIQDNQRLAPWTWSTLDADMARAVEDALKKAGVRNELCKVGVCTPEELDILEETCAGFFATLLKSLLAVPRPAVARGDATRCHGCGFSRESFFKPFMKCAGCSSAFYHSRKCQKKDWTDHKPNCYPPVANPNSNPASRAPPSLISARRVVTRRTPIPTTTPKHLASPRLVS